MYQSFGRLTDIVRQPSDDFGFGVICHQTDLLVKFHPELTDEQIEDLWQHLGQCFAFRPENKLGHVAGYDYLFACRLQRQERTVCLMITQPFENLENLVQVGHFVFRG